jgi:ParB/RepB/Spo0J family partition protein
MARKKAKKKQAAEDSPPDGGAELGLVDTPIDRVIPTPDNKRVIREQDASFRDLVASIRADGIQVPLMARPHPDQAGYFDLRAGHRRLRAAQICGLPTVPVLVRQLTDEQALTLTISENLNREDLTPMEEAAHVQMLLDRGYDVTGAADKLGRSESWVRRRAAIAELDPVWVQAMDDELSSWTAAHLELVARLPADEQRAVLEEWTKSYFFPEPRHWTVKDLREELSERSHRLADAPWDLDDSTLLPRAGACADCDKRSSCRPVLFEDLHPKSVEKDDRCLDPGCWNKKAQACREQQVAAAREKYGASLLVTTESGHLQNALKDQGVQATPHDTITRCKKSDPGAQPVLPIKGSGTPGKVYWATRRADTASAFSEGKTRDPETGKMVTWLKERRARLNARRLAWAIDALQLQVKETSLDQVKVATPDWEEHLLAIAVELGIGPAISRRLVRGATWENIARDAAKPMKDLWADLWEGIVPMLVQELSYGRTDAAEGCRDACVPIAGLIGADWPQLLQDAEAELPEPTSWKHLNADGTRKKKAGKQAKKKGRRGKMAAANDDTGE